MYERIVVGTDGSNQAHDAVRAAGRLAGLCGVQEIHVVTASRSYTAYDMARIEASLPEEFQGLVDPTIEAQERFDEARSILGPSVSVVPYLTEGHAAESILSVADKIDADLIVVGARGLGAVDRFVRGSVSTKVAHHSKCDVLIVEHPER